MKGTPPENLVRDVFRCRPATSHLVWGSVVPDIPEFCSELVVTLVSAPAGEPYPIDTDGDGHQAACDVCGYLEGEQMAHEFSSASGLPEDISEVFRLDGRCAVVTGAASGLGRAIALGFAQFGADVACLDIASKGRGGRLR